MARRLGRLEEPPISEVVCGSFFKSLPGLDPVTIGGFWRPRRAEYPRREFKVPIVATAPRNVEVSLGQDVGPLRTWLISRDDVFIIQVQHDRFYLNWRARQDAYPRFNDWDESEGLLSRFLREREAFEHFCAEELGVKPELHGIELAKIDHLERGRHWKDSRDLCGLLPMLRPAVELAESDPAVAIRMSTPRDDGAMEVAIETMHPPAQPAALVVRLESRRTIRRSIATGDLAAAFRGANEELNDLFLRLVPEDHHDRFGRSQAS